MSLDLLLERSVFLSKIPSEHYEISIITYPLPVDHIHGSFGDFEKVCWQCIKNPTHPHICVKLDLFSVQDLNGKKGHEIADICFAAMQKLAAIGIPLKQHVGSWSDGYVLQMDGYVLLPDRDRLIILYNHIKRFLKKGQRNFNTVFTVSANF